MVSRPLCGTIFAWAMCGAAAAAEPPPPPAAAGALAQILAASPPGDWREVDPKNTVYLDLPKGRVVIELAPGFAPKHVENIERLARQGYYDHVAIVRVQDDYVVQWADPDGTHPIGAARATLPAEFTRIGPSAAPFTPLPDADTYAPAVGYEAGFPSARDPATGEAWLTHCYGMVGAGRDNDADSGGGKELYAVIGQAPRQLDRNVTLVGRVVEGIELFSALPRGTQALGFYGAPAERTPVLSVKVAADLPPAARTPLEALRTDSATFAAIVENRRFRKDDWYKRAAGHIDVCNVPLPVRLRAARP